MSGVSLPQKLQPQRRVRAGSQGRRVVAHATQELRADLPGATLYSVCPGAHPALGPGTGHSQGHPPSAVVRVHVRPERGHRDRLSALGLPASSARGGRLQKPSCQQSVQHLTATFGGGRLQSSAFLNSPIEPTKEAPKQQASSSAHKQKADTTPQVALEKHIVSEGTEEDTNSLFLPIHMHKVICGAASSDEAYSSLNYGSESDLSLPSMRAMRSGDPRRRN